MASAEMIMTSSEAIWPEIIWSSDDQIERLRTIKQRLTEAGGVLSRKRVNEEIRVRKGLIADGRADQSILEPDEILFDVLADDGFDQKTVGLYREAVMILRSGEFQALIDSGHVAYFMVKPNTHLGLRRDLVGDVTDEQGADLIMNRIAENSGLEVMMTASCLLGGAGAEEHYKVHKDKPFFRELVEYISSGAVTIGVVYDPEGNALRKLIQAVGPTRPEEAVVTHPNSIRALAQNIRNNLIHRPDSQETNCQEFTRFVDFLDLFGFWGG